MNADERTTAEVEDTLNRFTAAYGKRDKDALTALLAPDADVTFIGTGADEERVGLTEISEQMERDWSQSESASMDWRRLSVSSQGSVAWVAGDVTLRAAANGTEIKLNGRITAVLDKRDGHWLIDQWHLSIPMAEQREGRSFPI